MTTYVNIAFTVEHACIKHAHGGKQVGLINKPPCIGRQFLNVIQSIPRGEGKYHPTLCWFGNGTNLECCGRSSPLIIKLPSCISTRATIEAIEVAQFG